MLKIIIVMILIVLNLGCEEKPRPDFGKKNQVQEFNLFVTPLPNLIFDGEQSEVTINLNRSQSSSFTYNWEVRDSNGDLASTTNFLEVSGSGNFPAGSIQQSFFITSISNSVAPGTVENYKIHFTALNFSQEATLGIRSTAGFGLGLNTVSIVGLGSNGYVNLTNRSSYPISGICSTPGGAINITATRSSSTITTSTFCDVNGEWSAHLDFTSSPLDGIYELVVAHSATGLTGTATRSITKDVTLPSLGISSPTLNSTIGVSQSSAFKMSGTCSENNQVITITAISSGGPGSVTSISKCLSGSWNSITDISSLADGSITAQAALSDLSGNIATVSRLFTKSSTVPTVTIDFPTLVTVVNSTTHTSQVFSGQCSENGALITLSGDVSGTLTTTCNSLSWSRGGITVTGADGFKTVTATITSSNTNKASVSVIFIKDTTAPIATLSGTPGPNHTDLNVEVGGSGVTHYQYKFGDSTLNCSISTGYSANRPISTLITNAIGANGAKRLCVVGIDVNGNVQSYSSATVVNWTKSSSTIITISSPLANSYVNSINESSFTVAGTCAIAGVNNVKIQGSLSTVFTNCTTGLWTRNLDFSSASDGPVFIVVSQEDPVTNLVSEATRIFLKSTNVPSISITSPAVNAYINNSNKAAFTVSGTCDLYSATPNIIVTGGITDVMATCNGSTWTANLTFPDSTNSTPLIVATISDNAGNSATSSRNFIMDTVNPTVAITAPADNSYIPVANLAAYSLSGTCSDNGTGNVVIRNSSATTLATANCVSNLWTANINLSNSAYPEGANTISITLSDSAGNTHSVLRTYNKDTTAPDIAWLDIVDGVCVSSINASSFAVKGSCSSGGQDGIVRITSARLASPVNVTCNSGSFSANLNINTAGLVDRQDFTINVAQDDSVGNSSNKNISVKFINTAPDITFNGWNDVYAIGKKTYLDGNPAEPGIVSIGWKPWTGSNTCKPNTVKVYRATTPDSLFGTRTHVSLPSGVPPTLNSFSDETLLDADFGKAWYYSLKIEVGGVEYNIENPPAIDEIRVIAPLDNMALVHRWITNQEVCGLMGRPTDPNNHYRCAYSGQGKVTTVDGDFHDMQHDLLVDRFESGCKITATCGAGGNTLCVSSKFGGADHPRNSAIPGLIGSVYYHDSPGGTEGRCWYKNGAANTAWTTTTEDGLNISELGVASTNIAHAPPLTWVSRDNAIKSCSSQVITDIPQIAEYEDNTPNAFPSAITKRLLRLKEWKAAAAWYDQMTYPSQYSSNADWIQHVEASAFRAPDTRAGKCNSNNSRHNNLTPAAREFLGFNGEMYNIHGMAFETGSKLATIDCQSRYGIQDMVGNLLEWGPDELSCTTSLPYICTGRVSSVDPESDEMNLFAFNGSQGPGGGTLYENNWTLSSGTNNTTHFNVVLGLPLVSNDGGGSISLNSIDLFSDWYQLHADPRAERSVLMGGYWDGNYINGRWYTNWTRDISNATFTNHYGFRCGLSLK